MQFCSQTKTDSNNTISPTSSWEKYKCAVVGERSLVDFVTYELYTLFIMSVPGKVGIRLRGLVCKRLLANLGKRTVLDRDITFRKPHQIELGSRVRIAAGTSFDVKSSKGLISINDHVVIGEKTIVNCIAGKLRIGKSSRVGKYVRLGSLLGLDIGNKCMIGDHVYISGAAHAFQDINVPIIRQPLTCKGTTSVGNNVIIGERTTISDGVHIGKNVEIAPNSFVNSDIPDNSFATGVPAIFFSQQKRSSDE